MSRYVTRPENPKASLWSDDPLLPHLTVEGEKQVNTGLVDLRGQAIYRLPPPVGFGRDDDW